MENDKMENDNKLFYWITLAVITYIFLDLATTIIGIKIGITELNPLITTIPGMIFTKILVLIIFVLLYRLAKLERRQDLGIKFYKCVSVIGAVVFVWNAAMIVGKAMIG